MRVIFVALLLHGLLAEPAAAAVTLRYAAESPDGSSLAIEADDTGNIRAEFGNGEAIVIRDGEGYFVIPDGRERAVVSLDDAFAVHAEGLSRISLPIAYARFRLGEHGPQRIGNWEGVRHPMEPLWPGGEPLDIVISGDPALATAARAFARVRELQVRLFNSRDNRDSNYQALAQSLFARGLMLRISGCTRLESLSTEPIPPSRFTLPGRIITRDQYRSILARGPQFAPCS